MEYVEHLVLICVPLFIVSPIALVILLTLSNRTERGICDCQSFLDTIVEITVGKKFVLNRDKVFQNVSRTKIKLYCCFLNVASPLCVIFALGVFWFTLVEEITYGRCDREADCFAIPRYEYKIKLPRRVNCSTFESDNDIELICYKMGFYVIEAFAKSGGMLYIINSLAKILLPLASGDEAVQHRCRKNIIVAILGVVGLAILITVLILSFTLPSSSLNFLTNILPVFISLTVGPLMLAVLIKLHPGEA